MNATAALFLTIACTSLSQIFQKKAAMSLENNSGSNLPAGVAFLINPNLVISVILLGSGFVSWLWVLSEWDVSFAYPFLSLNLVVVMCGSKFVFSENIKRHHWLGAFSIIAGVALISGGGAS